MPERCVARRRVPVILQAETSECGLAALAMIASAFGREIDLAGMRKRAAPAGLAPTLHALAANAAKLGLAARPVRLGIGELRRLALPAILHWEFDHFVVVTRVRRRHLVVHDPASGRRRVSLGVVRDAFTGVAVEFAPSGRWQRRDADTRPRLSWFIRAHAGIGAYLALMLVLLLVTQLLALAPPVATQFLIDEVLLGDDARWRTRVLAGVGLVLLAMIAIEALRRHIALYTGTRLAMDGTTSVVRHLFALPVHTVLKRPVGDLVSRLESLKPIRKALVETWLQGIVQLVILATTVAVMAIYSINLTLLAVSALGVVVAMQGALLPASRSKDLEAVVFSARAANSLIETLRAYQSVRALAIGERRLAQWQNHFVSATNAAAARARLGIVAATGQSLVNAGEHILFLGIGIAGVADRQLTLGTLFAFLSLRGRLLVAASRFLEVARELYLLRSHVERVGELVLEEPEPRGPSAAVRRRVVGAFRCERLDFRYPGGERILAEFSCRIGAGESVVVAGPSGAGKSTLLKLFAGVLAPERGAVVLDGVELAHWDAQVLRPQLGAVFQGDRLLNGTVAENISCFEALPDLARIREAGCAACIWRDLEALPMRLHTRLDAAGEGFSGGQIQRILIARALYRRPRVLLLDEATSQLDRDTETEVLGNLRALGVTMISVAHKRNALRHGGRLIRLRHSGC